MPQPDESVRRRLSAVMFADIEGYTRKFQEDEIQAMALSERHRRDLQEIVPIHGGTLVQTYGDGSLTVFDSAVEAVEAAIALQAASKAHGVPLRIGIHLGDLVFRDRDVFGDAVNIASRIQSLGVAGAVLVSDRIAAELRNHPEIKLQPLGFFRLKNVLQPMLLLAVVGPSLVVPPHASPLRSVLLSLVSKWQWLTGLALVGAAIYGFIQFLPNDQADWNSARVVILPFEHPKDDPYLDSISQLFYVILNKELQASGPPDVQSLVSTMLLTGGDEQKLVDPKFVLKSGCRYQLKGGIAPFGARGDSVQISAMIFDCARNKSVQPEIRPVIFPRQDVSQGRDQLLDVIKGYWQSGDTLPESKPIYSAYNDFLMALRSWGRDPKASDEPKQWLLRAIEKDSTFFEAYTFIMYIFFHDSKCQSAADTMAWIRDRFPMPTQIQTEFIQYHLLDIDGERVRAWKSFAPILARKPTDLHKGSDAVVMALEYLNDPDRAISAMKRIANPEGVLQDCPYCETYMINGIRAYTEKGQPKKAAKWVEIVRPHADRGSEIAVLSQYYLSTRQPQAIDQMIADAARKNENPRDRIDDLAYYYGIAFAVARQANHQELANEYLKKAFTYCRQLKDPGRIGRCLLWNAKAQESLPYYLEKLDTLGKMGSAEQLARYRGEIGIAYAQTGAIKNAREMIRLLETEDPGNCPYGLREYYIGRIYAHLGDKPQAMAYLNQSLMNGMLFTIGAYFHYDPLLSVLANDKDFQALLRSRKEAAG